MDIISALKDRRTIRRFSQFHVARELLVEMVDCARLAPSAANLQPLEYLVVDDPQLVEALYGMVTLGSYFKGDDRIGHDQTEAPTAYIVVLTKDTAVKWSERDLGASTFAILLAAHAHGLASCWIANVKRDKVRNLLVIPEDLTIDCLVALGHPAEESHAVPLVDGTQYWYDASGRLQVPKRSLDDVVSFNRYS